MILKMRFLEITVKENIKTFKEQWCLIMYKYERAAITKFGNNYKKNKSNEFIFQCLKCGRPKLYVNTLNGVFHCFRCNYKGRLKTKTTLKDIKEKHNMQSLLNITNNKDEQLILIPFISVPLTEEQKQALKNRGLSEDDIKYYNICGRQDDNRIQIPNYVRGCFTDVICAWQYDKTKITNKNPKYLNSEGTKKANTLFNIYNIDNNIDQIILTEGIFNAITAGRNAVASYGCSLSNRQCQLIIEKQPKSILLAYDSDEPGVKGTNAVIKQLIDVDYKGTVEYVLLPKGVDINDLGHDNFVKYCDTNKVKIDLSSPISIKLPKLLFDSRI